MPLLPCTLLPRPKADNRRQRYEVLSMQKAVYVYHWGVLMKNIDFEIDRVSDRLKKTVTKIETSIHILQDEIDLAVKTLKACAVLDPIVKSDAEIVARKGDHGPIIFELQARLNKFFETRSLTIDGKFEDFTKEVLEKFEAHIGHYADGALTAENLKRLRSLTE